MFDVVKASKNLDTSNWTWILNSLKMDAFYGFMEIKKDNNLLHYNYKHTYIQKHRKAFELSSIQTHANGFNTISVMLFPCGT